MTTQVANQAEERHGLFRKQAVEKQQDRLLGDVLVVPPLSFSLITAVIIIFVALALALLFNASYARKETVQGYLIPDKGLVKVFASTEGIVRKVLVSEGEEVAFGQPLFVINGDRVLENGEHLEDILLQEYEQQRSLLAEKLDQLPAIQQHRLAEIEQQRLQLATDHKHLSAQFDLLQNQIDIVKRQLADIRNLFAKGAVNQSTLDAAIEKHIALTAELQSINRTLDANQAQTTALDLQEAALVFDENSQRNQLEQSLSSLAQQIAQLHGQRAYVVKATQTGVVSNIQITEGQEANTTQPLLTITPAGSELLAELLIPTRAIGFVEPGQPVKLRYSAYSYQKFGLYDASVVEVSKAVLLPQELSNVRIGVQEPVYRVTAKLAQHHVEAYGKPLALKAGIALEADIKLADRTLIEWLLEPLFSLKGRV